jgi:ABC-2 type transport system permease protein
MVAKVKYPNLRFLCRLYCTSFKQVMALKASFFLRILFMIINNLIMLVGWFAVFNTFKTINGWSFSDFMFMRGLVVICFSIWSLFFRGAGIYTARLIEYGDLDTYLMAPKNILLHTTCSQTDPAGFGDLLSGIILLTASGLISFSNIGILLFCILIGASLFVSLGIFLGALNFYVSDCTDFGERLFYLFLSITGYPGCIYTGLAKLILISLFPTGLISILPVEQIHHPDTITLLWMFFVSCVLLTGSILFFYNGLKRYESGNRIGGKL